LPGLPQPHWQLRSWQVQASFWQSQAQISQLQAPPQWLEWLVSLYLLFVELDIVVLPYLNLRVMRFQRG
jgi:hypothetical protein